MKQLNLKHWASIGRSYAMLLLILILIAPFLFNIERTVQGDIVLQWKGTGIGKDVEVTTVEEQQPNGTIASAIKENANYNAVA